MDDPIVRCAQCRRELNGSDARLAEPRPACPRCGSVVRDIHARIGGHIDMTASAAMLPAPIAQVEVSANQVIAVEQRACADTVASLTIAEALNLAPIGTIRLYGPMSDGRCFAQALDANGAVIKEGIGEPEDGILDLALLIMPPGHPNREET